MSKADWARERAEAIRTGKKIDLTDWSFGAERPQVDNSERRTGYLSDVQPGDPDYLSDAELAAVQARVALWNQAPNHATDPDAWEAWTNAHAKELGL